MQHHSVLRDIPPFYSLTVNIFQNFQANDSQQSKMTVFPYFLLRQLPNTPWHYVIGFSPKKSKMTPNPCLILLGWTTSSPHFMSSSPLPPPPHSLSNRQWWFLLPAIDALLFGDSFWQMLLMRENTSCIMYSEAVWLWSSSTHLKGDKQTKETSKKN